ncbi:MAG TPA: tetratricopeptide repeat protein [Gemmatimonadaceae bacterium]
MTDPSSASRGALQALEAVRSAVERLASSRSPQDNASDVTAICSGVELALGAVLARTDLSGQALVREARQREAISLEQAHAALELFAVRDRIGTSGQVDSADLDVAREAYGALVHGFETPPAPGAGATPAATAAGATAAGAARPVPERPSGSAAPGSAAASGPLGSAGSGAPEPAPHDAPPNRWPVIAVVVVVVLVLLGLYYVVAGHRAPSALDAGIAAYTAGQRDSARVLFTRAATQSPSNALPHLYLGRMAREDGDYSTAGKELRTAVQLDPSGAAGQRELGAFFLARGGSFASESRPDLASQDYDAARRAYVRAIQINGSDTASQGYLACALARLGRADEAATWLKRAGAGPWSTCATTPAAP